MSTGGGGGSGSGGGGGGKKFKNKNKLSIKIQKKKVFRVTDPLIAVFMWGANYTCNELKHVSMPEFLMPDDFKAFIKVKVDNQYFNKDTLPSHYKVKEYCPLVFKRMRERFGISDESYVKSLTYGEIEPLDCSSGKSQAKFFISYDKRYIIKTIATEDVEGLHNILKDYHKHVIETRGETLLPHLLSMYRLTVEDKENYMLVMRNAFNPHFRVHVKYDIKGSTVDRAATTKEKEKDSPTFKDNDFVSDGRQIKMGQEAKKAFMQKLTKDVDFLCQLKLMDYSLLIGVHDCDKAALGEQAENFFVTRADGAPKSTKNSQSDDNRPDSDHDNFSPTEDTEDTDDDQLNLSGQTPPDSPTSKLAYGIFGIPAAEPRHEVYFMALIDILTHYGLKKKSANVAKTVKYGADGEISTVKPEQYAKRFLDFINKIIE